MRKMEARLDGPYALSQSHLTQPSVKNDSKLYNALAWRWIVLLILYILRKVGDNLLYTCWESGLGSFCDRKSRFDFLGLEHDHQSISDSS